VINIHDDRHDSSSTAKVAAPQVENTCGLSGMSNACCVILMVQVFFAVMMAGSYLLYMHEYDPWVNSDEHEVISEYRRQKIAVSAAGSEGNKFSKAKLANWEMFRPPCKGEGRYELHIPIWNLPGDEFKKTGFHKSVIETLSAWESDKSKDKPDGMTIDPFTGEKLTTGTMVAIDGCEVLKDYKNLKAVKKWIHDYKDVLIRKDRYLGVWISKETGKAVIEISTRVEDLDKAILLGMSFQQEGVFELGSCTYHDTFGKDTMKGEAARGLREYSLLGDFDGDNKTVGCFGRLFSFLRCGRRKK